jgi:predicted branched-subunit amino acid permease
MNIAKHMEAVFVAALAFAGSASFIADTLPAAQAHTLAPVAAATTQQIPVVVVSAKRMTPAEKLASMPALRDAPRGQG